MSDSENESAEEELKVVLLGDSSVGKTSLIKRLCNNEFTKQYFPTLGVDFFLKKLSLQRARNVALKIWDVGGASLNSNMLDKYVFGSNIIVLVYDVTNEPSFYNLELWIELVNNIIKQQEKQPMFALLGNKCDLEHQRAVKIEKHQRFAGDHHLFSQIVSARTGECVSLAFRKIAAEYLDVKLTKSEIEECHLVVKAEISTYTDLPLQPVRNLSSSSRSSVCSIQ